MSAIHDQVHAFADGELSPEEALVFREHLADCGACQRELQEILQLQAVSWAPRVEAAAKAGVTPLSFWRRGRTMTVTTSLLAMAAAVALIVRSSGSDDLLVPGAHRHLEARLSYAGADHYRPYDVERGGAPSAERPSMKRLAALEERSDWRGLAAAALLTGDRDQAAVYLDKVGATAEADSDRAALDLQKGDYETAITLADKALRARPGMTQALWNRALAEHELGLDNVAARSFAEVAAKGEPGWADEAAKRADALKREVEAVRARSAALNAAGDKMLAGGPPIPLDLARSGFGRARHFFYDAVRSAGSRARVLELQPLAEELDRLDHGDELQKYVAQIAAADFTVRAPLAALYQSLAVGKGPSDNAGQLALFDRFRRSGQTDQLFGALVATGHGADDVAALSRSALATGDRDLIGIADYYRAAVQASTDIGGAVSSLIKEVATCDHGVQLRCANNELMLTVFLITMHRPAEARIYGLDAWRRARPAGDESLSSEILGQMGEVHLLADRFSLVRAYLDENTLRMPDDAAARAHAQETAALSYVAELKPDLAHAELAAIRKSGRVLDGNGIWAMADLAHRGISADERAFATQGAVAMRKALDSPGFEPLSDFFEGRLVIDVDPERGRQLLGTAIKKAERLSHDDADAQKARAFSYQTLIVAAASANGWSEALKLFAEEAGLPLSDRCVVAVATDNERDLAVVRDASGQIRGSLTSRSEPTLDAVHFVPAADVASLASCPSVTVLARPPLYGNPDLLPASLAWSYRVGHPVSAGATAPGAERRVIVSDVEPPPSLRLPKLTSWRGGESKGDSAPVELKGPAATPARVLSEIADATEVVFNAHGMVDTGQSDATMLVLSPDAEGRYALSVADLRGQHLRGAPLVILAACRAGELIVPSPHEPISLPSAFLRAGARAVLASSAPIPDADAGLFFDAVRARVARGAQFAVALRDERQAWLTKDASSWVRQVMLFE